MEQSKEIRNLFPNEQMYREWRAYHGMTSEERRQFEEQNRERFNAMTPDEQAGELELIREGVRKTADFADEIILRDKLGKLADYISFSRIARDYFGKSSSWLYHRLKGTLINGKPARFTEEQKKKLVEAFTDLSKDFEKASMMFAS
jgi:hypothetical protein